MLRKYRDLLPSYLNGGNILKHASVIEAMDKEIDDRIDLLRSWNVLERPILIQKNQSWNNLATLDVYVNTKTPIREILVKGTYNGNTITDDTITYEEDDLTTTTTLTYDLLSTIFVGPTGVNLPTYTVQVTTYDERVYTKKWPENDTPRGDSADHDEFLDIIGAILGIQRRKYSRYVASDVDGTVPPYMAKGINDGVIQECTEDDYDYYARLKEFVTGFEETELLTLMAKVLYSIDSSIVEWDTSRWYPVDIGENTIPLYLRKGNYENYPVTNVTGLLENYVPATRELFTFLATDYVITITNASYYPNYAMWEGNVALADMSVRDATLVCYKFNPDVHVFCVTDSNGEFHATLGGNPPRIGNIAMYVGGENLPPYASPQTASRVISPYSVFYMELLAWNGIKYVGTPIITTTDISKDTTTGDIVAGHGVLCYTPALDFDLVSTSAYKYTVSFHYTDRFQRVGFAKVTENNGTASYNEGILLNVVDYLGSSDLNTTHTLTARILDGTMYLYLDGDYTGKNYDYSNVTEGMLCFVALNNRKDAGQELRIGSGSIADVDISTPPAQVTFPESLDTDYISNWSFNLRGTSSTDPAFNDDGTITMGKYTYHIPEYKLNTNKVYTVHFYKNDVSVEDLGIGICDAQRPPVTSNTPSSTAASGAVTGNNKVQIFYESNTWKKRYNNSTNIISLNTVDDGNKYPCITTTNNAGNMNKILYITEANFNSLAITDSTKWATIQSSSTNTPPSTSSDGYDCGRNIYNVFEDYILLDDTTNKTVEIEFNTNSSSFRIGLVRYTTGTPGWNSTYFASNQATVSTGTHILKFIADNNGEWTTYLDDTRTSTASFTLPNESKLGAIQYTNNKYVKILGVRVYDNNE